ncbi:PAS domain-containing protein [Gaoshiqia sp. Z1-71]|uniref:PAS domain-containing protein n=1 Tax=Gaoshiqia hydrogeniformans TaxID=3290090 RepID=UPI003BF7FA4D
MSEFTHKRKERVQQLAEFARQMMSAPDKARLVKDNEKLISQLVPAEVITLFDVLVGEQTDLNALKTTTNKILHLFHTPLMAYPALKPAAGSFLDLLARNNLEMENLLKSMKPAIKTLNQDLRDAAARNDLNKKIDRLKLFHKHYQIKENVLFPALETHWPDFRCVQLMWSYHDDIRRQMSELQKLLEPGDFEMKAFNRLTGDLFFNLFAIRFREERILFPHILETIPQPVIEQMLADSLEIGFPYVSPEKTESRSRPVFAEGTNINLGTGTVSPEQISLIFNHLPVDITFVDEHDTVRYFSSPKKRIFPRTKAVIGRKVHHCHPPESVHVVEEIVSTFRNGEKEVASFWINFKDEKILIQYFALRDENGTYKGVIEVAQEISAIQQLQGEKRLLDWGEDKP